MRDEILREPVEAPSGKGAGDENFPVASWLIAPRQRPHVLAFYAFARPADDIADAPELSPDEKLRRLDAMEAGLDGDGPESAKALARSVRETGIDDVHARTLLIAFRHDARVDRCPDWSSLADYCTVSAHPVGRHVLALHGEAEETWPLSDPLCAALQVLNHLQDIGSDFHDLGRIYLPADWMAEHGVAEIDLGRDRATRALGRVIDRCLDGCDAWFAASEGLPRAVKDRRLAAECAVIWSLAKRLSARLRRQDPLAARVSLSKSDVAAAFGQGLRRLLR